MLSRASFFVIFILMFLVALTCWYAASLTRITSLPSGDLINVGIISNVNISQTTGTGTLEYRGSIKTATEMNNGDVNFQTLMLQYFNGENDHSPWTLTADQGNTIDNNSEITLEGHVVASRPEAANIPPLMIQTDSAIIYPDKQLIKGSDLITFSEPGSINKTTAVGFIANLHAKWLKLLSQVRSVYAPS